MSLREETAKQSQTGSKPEIFHIAIDGPVASGKGTVAAGLSERLGIPCLDTGAMYRAFAVHMNDAVNLKSSSFDSLSTAHALETFDLSVRIADKTFVTVNGVDVTDKIRSEEISMLSSKLSVNPEVRKKMVALQRQIAQTQSFILEGRDISSVVLPDARFKFYLTAKLKVRAKRRRAEYKTRGIEISLGNMIKQIKQRDKNDKHKPVGALKRVRGAVLIDNTNLTREQTIDKFLSYVKMKSE